jgi:hypothetical protein
MMQYTRVNAQIDQSVKQRVSRTEEKKTKRWEIMTRLGVVQLSVKDAHHHFCSVAQATLLAAGTSGKTALTQQVVATVRCASPVSQSTTAQPRRCPVRQDRQDFPLALDPRASCAPSHHLVCSALAPLRLCNHGAPPSSRLPLPLFFRWTLSGAHTSERGPAFLFLLSPWMTPRPGSHSLLLLPSPSSALCLPTVFSGT